MTKMAAMPLYVKNPSKSFPEPVDRFQSDFTLIIGDWSNAICTFILTL